jgi:hypothetical protein
MLRAAAAQQPNGKGPAAAKAKAMSMLDARTVSAIVAAVGGLADETGWVQLSRVGDGILKKLSDFDPRNFGYKRLTDLLSDMAELKVESRKNERGINNLCVKVREKLR